MSHDWFDEFVNNARKHKDRALLEWGFKEKVATVGAGVGLAARLAKGEDVTVKELMNPQGQSKSSNSLLWLKLVGGVFVVGTVVYVFSRRRYPPPPRYYPGDGPSVVIGPPSTSSRLLTALRTPLTTVSSAWNTLTTSAPIVINRQEGNVPPTSSSSSTSSTAISSSPTPSITSSAAPTFLHRTSHSISVAWDRLAPRFGNLRTQGRRFFASVSGSLGLQSVPPMKAGMAYVEMELPQFDHHVSPDHIAVLDAALTHATQHLYVGLITDVSQMTEDELNELLGLFYNAIASLAYGKHRKPIDYAFTVVLPLPNTPANELISDVRSRIAQIPDLGLRLFPQNADGNVREQTMQALLDVRNEKQLPIVLSAVMNVTVNSSSSSSSSTSSSNPKFRQYSDVVLGGTFDHLHAGHKILLTVAALLASKSLVIGLTADSMLVNKKYKETMESWAARLQSVIDFLHIIHPSLEVDLVPLHDMYGPSGDRDYLKCLVVSEETAKGGEMVNAKRKSNGLNDLDIVIVKLARPAPIDGVPMTGAEKISSTQLRQYDAERSERQRQFLSQRWQTLCHELRVSKSVMETEFQTLCARYSESHRSYHTLDHIEALLNLASDASQSNLLSRPHEVELAIWYHDIIYDTPSSQQGERPAGSNERESAEAFKHFAQQTNLAMDTIERVEQMILATIKHQLPSDTTKNSSPQPGEAFSSSPSPSPPISSALDESGLSDLKFFLDFDLSILGANEQVYSRYTSSIRTEYIHYAYDTYLRGRYSILQRFLERPVLYFTPEYQITHESRARYNIRKEIQKIQQAPELQHHLP